jgi:hypothetical protein
MRVVMTTRNFRRLGLCALVATLLVAPGGIAQPEPAQPTTDTGISAYRKVLRSTVWVHSSRGEGKLATGSGSLIDKGRRLVLTNYHVVGDVKAATVFFPAFDGKRAIPERKYYLDRARSLGIPGEVVEVDKAADLALIRLDRVPDDAPAVPLAAESPDPGQTVHSVGNPGRSGALWIYTPGKVRQVYSKTWKAKLDGRVHTFQARVVETDSPTNPGDSGGPLVNDKGELVGVTEGGATDAQLLSLFVDISEVKKLLRRRSVVALRTTEAVAADPPKKEDDTPKPAHDKVLESKDNGKFFGEEAWKQVQPAAERLFKEKGTDLVIETYDKVPKGDPAKVKAMSKDEKEKFFHELVTERVKALKLNGVYVLVTRTPTYLYVGTTGDAIFPSGSGSMIRQTLLSTFRQKKYDQGLSKVLQIALEAKGLGDKK